MFFPGTPDHPDHAGKMPDLSSHGRYRSAATLYSLALNPYDACRYAKSGPAGLACRFGHSFQFPSDASGISHSYGLTAMSFVEKRAST